MGAAPWGVKISGCLQKSIKRHGGKNRGAALSLTHQAAKLPSCRISDADAKCRVAVCRVPNCQVTKLPNFRFRCQVPSAQCLPSAQCRVPSADAECRIAECRVPMPMLMRLMAMSMRDGDGDSDDAADAGAETADEMLLALGRTVAMAMRDTDGDARWRW